MHGVDTNREDAEGGTALMYACRTASAPVVRALIQAGASPTCVDKSGMSAYMFAAAYANAGSLSALLAECGAAHINSRDSTGRTVLHWVRL